jgi:hypothetical protein
MKRLVLPLLLSGALLGLGVASATAAASTTTIVVNVNDSSTDTETCGFPLDVHTQGSFKHTEFFDTNGNLVKVIETNTGGPFTITITNPANGKTATTQSQTFVVVATDPVRISGIVGNFVLPGTGAILMDVGTIVFDSNGNVLMIGGPHQQFVGDLEGFCAAMADP